MGTSSLKSGNLQLSMSHDQPKREYKIRYNDIMTPQEPVEEAENHDDSGDFRIQRETRESNESNL